MPFTADFLTPAEADIVRKALIAYSDNTDAIEGKLASLTKTARYCVQCGAEFTSKNPRRTTCSDACRQALSRSIRKAEYTRTLEKKLAAT